MCIRDRGDADTVISASEQVPAKIVTINTSVGTLKAKLYDDVHNHVRTFIEMCIRDRHKQYRLETADTEIQRQDALCRQDGDESNNTPGRRL